MKGLDKEQIKALEAALVARHIVDPQQRVELFDHISSMIEHDMEQGKTFEQSLKDVMDSITEGELSQLVSHTHDPNINTVRRKKRLNSLGLWLGGLTCLWILMEYIIGSAIGKPELGAYYGLISEIILITVLIMATRHLMRSGHKTFKSLLLGNMRIVLISAGMVLAFMLLYANTLNPKLYGILEDNSSIPETGLMFGIVFAMGLAMLVQGMIVSLLIGLIGPRVR